MRNIAVILAGGIGARVGGNTPKQLLPLSDGHSVLEHAVNAFEQSPHIHEICIVMHPDYIMHAEQMLLANAWQKVRYIIPGGKERWESSVNAIRAIMNQDNSLPFREGMGVGILLHDAARPFVSQDIIARVCEALEEHEAVTVAIPSTDTVYEMADGKVARIPQRATIMRAQTPQAFRLELIAEAYAKALGTDICDIQACSACHLPATDDCGIVHKHMPQVPIYIVEGEEQNKKITFKEDI
ncbi:MAG: 2-C-methyl-D-erythritol 4-phosphate cytidylyltransferase [Paludibacteraceae bacterium]|nr:2-C-methyl-D-erythritol 4-phosphate cytidylyltransferase [Paludibacteraceae bacterium]